MGRTRKAIDDEFGRSPVRREGGPGRTVKAMEKWEATREAVHSGTSLRGFQTQCEFSGSCSP